eukprot:TRINITY_DN958_c0_g1_i4.p1 TRINITY_DN958_c0_g1~~TRINITY_DN958_c0_g1_i4.p1  ORF type:complete len:169 (-),score=23.51 TRINITY_DN958_c0_g1_i4:27-533(-)
MKLDELMQDKHESQSQRKKQIASERDRVKLSLSNRKLKLNVDRVPSESAHKGHCKDLSEQVKVADLELLSLAEHVRKSRNITKPSSFVKVREKNSDPVKAAKMDDLHTTLALEREEVKRLKERLDESKSETMEILDSLQTELSKSKTEVSRLTNELLECYNHINWPLA